MHLSAGEGQSYWLINDRHTFKAVGAETGGAFAVSEVTALPGFGPPPHIHQREDESFYVLEGEFEITYDGRTVTMGAGSFVHLPKGRLHMHRAVGSRPARILALYAPAGVERFIEEAGTPATDGALPSGPPEMSALERIVAIAGKYGIEVPAPPAAATAAG